MVQITREDLAKAIDKLNRKYDCDLYVSVDELPEKMSLEVALYFVVSNMFMTMWDWESHD